MRPPATIVATATAVPPHRASQAEIKDAFARAFPMDARRLDALLTSIFDNAAIEQRHSVYPLEAIGRRPLGETMLEYRKHALPLGRQVVREALARAQIAADAVDLIVCVSCTGVMIPSLDAHLCGELGFRSDVRRLPITELGCSAGAAALGRAADFLCGFPDGVALVLSVELPSLNLQLGDLSRDNLVSSALFGDGAAAAVVRAGEHAGVQILDSACHLLPRSTDALGFDLRDDGFHCVLSKALPALLRPELAALVDRLLARAGVPRGDLAAYVVHPGGKPILGCVEEALGLRRDQTQPSWDVLRDFGNQSSAGVLFVLEDWIRRRGVAAGAPGLLIGFGPGLTTEMALLRWS